jgi:hypothetical protein
MPELLPVAEQLLSENSQADPQLRTGKVYTRVTGKSLRVILADSLGIPIASRPQFPDCGFAGIFLLSVCLTFRRFTTNRERYFR